MSKGPPNYEGPSDSVPDYDLTYALNILQLLFPHITPGFTFHTMFFFNLGKFFYSFTFVIERKICAESLAFSDQVL